MNQQDKSNLEQRLQSIRQIDLPARISAVYPEQDITSLRIGKYTAEEIISLHEKVFINFDVVMEEGYWQYIPTTYTLQGETYNGQYNLHSDFQNYQNTIANGNLTNLYFYLDLFILYQIIHGFWDKSGRKFHYAKSTEILNLKAELQAVKENATSEFKKYKKRKEEIDALLNNVSDFYQNKQRELQSIADNAATAANTLQQINNTNAEVGVLKEKISGILEQQNNLLNDSKKSIEEHLETLQQLTNSHKEAISKENEEYTERRTALDEYLKELAAKDKLYKEALEYAQNQKEFLEKKREEIIKLTGLAADGSLGHTFNKRSTELGKNVTLWGGGLVMISILSVVWVVVVFYCFNNAYSPQWLGVLINILKTSPAFILLGFAISQYNKERHLQEEYAFKAAVAMTITAYSDRITDVVKKEDMLWESTQKVYRNPNTLLKKDTPLISFGSKALTESMKDISETLKNIKG